MTLSSAAQRYRPALEIAFWSAYLSIAASVEAFSVITEYARINRPLSEWEPFVWEFSSAISLGLLIPAVARLNREFPLSRESWARSLGVHLLATVPFSLLHVGIMVALRKGVYLAAGRAYEFGPLATELPYEFRKDFVTYWFVIAIFYLWTQLLPKDAPPPAAGEDEDAPLSRLMAKKHGREFLINTQAIDWIEASGNYANLHSEGAVFPVRVSMSELERRLNPEHFARVHRSYIVNLDAVREIRPTDGGDHSILTRDGANVRFSRRYRSALKGRLDV